MGQKIKARIGRIERMGDRIHFAFFGERMGFALVSSPENMPDAVLLRENDEVEMTGEDKDGVFRVATLISLTLRGALNMLGVFAEKETSSSEAHDEIVATMEFMKRPDWVKNFVRHTGSPSSFSGGIPLVSVALRSGRLDLAEWLIAEGADLKATDSSGKGIPESVMRMECHSLLTPRACEEIRSRIMLLVYERDPNFMDKRDFDGMNPFESAFMNSTLPLSLTDESFGNHFLKAWKASVDVSTWVSGNSLKRVSPHGKNWVREILSALSITDGWDLLDILGIPPDEIVKGGRNPVAESWAWKDWGGVDRKCDPLSWKNMDGDSFLHGKSMHLSLIKRCLEDERFLYSRHKSGEWSFANALVSSPQTITFVNAMLAMKHERAVPFIDWKTRMSQFMEKEKVEAYVANGCCATAASNERIAARWGDEELKKALFDRNDEWNILVDAREAKSS